jgi:peptidoglycan/LPS O-acetylase OafA/YrhL
LINNFTAKVGLVSYSVYLLHPPVIALLQGFYRSIYSWGASQSLSYLFCLLITLAIVIPLSIITFTIIEKPGIKLGNSLIKQL